MRATERVCGGAGQRRRSSAHSGVVGVRGQRARGGRRGRDVERLRRAASVGEVRASGVATGMGRRSARWQGNAPGSSVGSAERWRRRRDQARSRSNQEEGNERETWGGSGAICPDILGAWGDKGEGEVGWPDGLVVQLGHDPVGEGASLSPLLFFFCLLCFAFSFCSKRLL